jgi:hypothetical protein
MQTPKYFYFRVYDINKGTGIKVEDVSDVDVAEIIRCKDCRWSEIGAWDIRWCIYDKKNRTKAVEDDDYCSWAERRMLK